MNRFSPRLSPRAMGLCSLLVLLSAQAIFGQKVPLITTVAGGFINDGKAATEAAFNFPTCAAQDREGNLYISDSQNNRIRKVDTQRIVTTIAGTGIAGYSGDGGPAVSATMNSPACIVVDPKGDVLFADTNNNRVRKIDAQGAITTVAGDGSFTWSGDNGPASSAGVGAPWGLALDSSGNLYIAQTFQYVIRKVDPSGVIHTVVGNGLQGFGGVGDGGPATSARLNSPEAIVFDNTGNLYLSEIYDNRIRRVDTAGVISTFAGNGIFSCFGDGGPASSASILLPTGLTVWHGTLVISSECEDSLRAVSLGTNIIDGVAGAGSGFNGDGLAPLSTQFLFAQGLTTDRSGELLVVDSGNGRVRKVSSSGVYTIAGGYTGDGAASIKSNLNVPTGIGFDAAGNLFVVDSRHNRVRRISTDGAITTLAGNGLSGSSGDGGPAISATLTPWAVAADLNGNIFIADLTGGVRKVDANGIITHLNGPSYPTSISTDSAGNVYASANPVIWKITPDGTATIIAGVANQVGYNGDGIPATQAYLSAPSGTVFDAKGNLYIADAGNSRIRKVDANGIITTVAGNGSSGFSGDGGLATNAEISYPQSISVDEKGDLYIADYNNYRIRLVDPSGIIRTVAGTGNRGYYNGDRLPANRTNIYPVTITISPLGVVHYSDGFLVRRIR